jgi:hypothetical protein
MNHFTIHSDADIFNSAIMIAVSGNVQITLVWVGFCFAPPFCSAQKVYNSPLTVSQLLKTLGFLTCLDFVVPPRFPVNRPVAVSEWRAVRESVLAHHNEQDSITSPVAIKFVGKLLPLNHWQTAQGHADFKTVRLRISFIITSGNQ